MKRRLFARSVFWGKVKVPVPSARPHNGIMELDAFVLKNSEKLAGRLSLPFSQTSALKSRLHTFDVLSPNVADGIFFWEWQKTNKQINRNKKQEKTKQELFEKFHTEVILHSVPDSVLKFRSKRAVFFCPFRVRRDHSSSARAELLSGLWASLPLLSRLLQLYF